MHRPSGELLLILTARFGAGRVLRRLGADCATWIGSGCVLTGWGCVLRTPSASIWKSSALLFLSLIDREANAVIARNNSSFCHCSTWRLRR
jgi:hypothetical protein